MSLWAEYKLSHSYDSLKENKIVDTLIIGGGMVGVQTMYYLKDRKDVMLVEANKIGMGVSANTTGKINYLQESTLGYLIEKGKFVTASMYLASQIEGINFMQDIILQEQIDCDFEKVTSYLVTNDENKVKSLKKIKNFLNQKGISVLEEIPKQTSFSYGIGVTDTYVFHPLKYLDGILKSLTNSSLYENTRIVKIQKKDDVYVCETNDHFQIIAQNVICCCHYPFFLFPYFLPVKTEIEKSYLLAKKASENLKYTYITMESDCLSSRFYETNQQVYQIFLGKNHKTSVLQNDQQNLRDVKHKLSLEDFSYQWSNVDILTFDHLPFIGKIKPNFYLATGFQTWGMIQSIVSAKMISFELEGKISPYQALFDPKRKKVMRTCLLPYYLGVNFFSFVRSKFYKKNWYDAVTFYYEDGKLIGCYKDLEGVEHKVHPVCPHMKCGLIFNPVDKTWDCPCHSSRFSMDGKVLKGPSTYSISYTKEKK